MRYRRGGAEGEVYSVPRAVTRQKRRAASLPSKVSGFDYLRVIRRAATASAAVNINVFDWNVVRAAPRAV
jgi:hypothetical protein